MDLQSSANKLDEGSQQIKGRRKRNDQNNRDFACGCGKSYLSYAALYTHLKQKHDSKAPNGTLLPSQGNQKTGRGRPRRVWNHIKQLDENDPKSIKSDDEKSLSYNEPEETIEEMLTFLDSLGQFRNNFKLLSEEEKASYLIDNFPTDIFNNKSDYYQILSYIKSITRERISNNLDDPINNEEIDNGKNIRKTIINKILAYFLVQIGYKLNIEAYREMAIFVIFFQKSLNAMGYKAIEAYDQQEQKIDESKQQQYQNGQSQYCEEQNGEHILLISNEFILQFLPSYYSSLGQTEKQFEIFGSSDEKLRNAVYITQHLSYWLYAFKFTNSRLALYTEDD